MSRTLLSITAVLFLCGWAAAQDNYEIQVYGSDTVEPPETMVELHSNFTVEGSNRLVNGLLPTTHAFHETLEITHGFATWMEVGWYVFTYAKSGYGYQWVGDHIRPRVKAPDKWKWPVGVSLSTEFGYQRRQFAPDTWTLEIRPIVDKKIGPWYLAFNPAVDRSLHGPGVHQGWGFSPDGKFSYDLTKKIAAGLEYYGSLGPIGNFDPLAQQQQQIFPTIDLNLSPAWEFNFGVGVGSTRSTDHLIVKMILGRRFQMKSGHN